MRLRTGGAAIVRRYELSDEAYRLIEDLLPANGKRGRQWNDHRRTLNGIFWILHTGAQWRELPERYGKWKSAHDRHNRWSRDGTIDRMLARLQLKLTPKVGSIRTSGVSTPPTYAPADPRLGRGKKYRLGEPTDHALGRSRGGFTTKLHLLLAGGCVPLAVVASAGQCHESRFVDPVLRAVRLVRSAWRAAARKAAPAGRR